MKLLKLGFVSDYSSKTIESLFSNVSSIFDARIHDYTGDVCHYFPTSALMNILPSQSFIMSDAEFLNDIEEDNNLFLILDQMLSNELINLGIEPELIKDLKEYPRLRSLMPSDIVYSNNNNRDGTIEDSDNFIYNERQYVFCTSKDNDSLAMWKYYSKGNRYDAYNVLFSTEEFLGCVTETYSCMNHGIRIMHGSVIYSDSLKKEILVQVIREINKLYKEHLADTSSDFAIRKELVNRFFYLIKDYSIFFKNEAYRHEKEYRFVIKIDNTNIKKHRLEYGFRNVNTYLIPFLKVKFKKEMIKVLIANPTISGDSLAIKSVAAFADYYDYSQTDIGVSTIPLRY